MRVLTSKIFINREVLRPDYIPDHLPHREDQIRSIASVVSVALQGERPSNLFIYGVTGTGKTAVTKYVLRRLSGKGIEFNRPVSWIYVNSRIDNTSYRIFTRIGEEIGLRLPFTGLSTAEVYKRVRNALDSEERVYIIVVDEIDFIARNESDEILYKLTRINEDLNRAKVSFIGITNNIRFVENLDARVRSSLGEEEIVFPPYNALQLEEILWERARIAFRENAITEEAIKICAAIAAREHGDARRALDLLRISGEIAEREGSSKVLEEHVHKAYYELERERVVQIISTLPFHSRLVLYAILKTEVSDEATTTGELYALYRDIAIRFGIEPVTQRRVSDIVSELEVLGIISARIYNRGRYGKTRVLRLAVNPLTVLEVLRRDTLIRDIMEGELEELEEKLRGSTHNSKQLYE
ncbi:MAG: orc1/cdc6 family replication initiation protein [Sulfolobales archaeon]